jgi:putative heme-binding domain-containing protein
VTCHNPWNQFTLAYTEAQLDRWQAYGERGDNQVRSLRHVGLLAAPADRGKRRPEALVDPLDAGGDLNRRARSYLHVNCAHCHQFGGGGSTLLELRYSAKLEEMHLVDEPPTQGTFDLSNARVVRPGDPDASVLFYRLAKSGRGHMPHLGSRLVDVEGLGVLDGWICRLPRGSSQSAPPGKAGASVEALGASTSGALEILRAIDSGALQGAERDRAIARGTAHPSELVRDLFERWLPPEKRARRLGDRIDPSALLAVEGDVERGEAYFFGSSSCKSCHRVGAQGGLVGPELTRIGGKLSRALIVEKLLTPSKNVEPAYALYFLETEDGQVYSGLLAKRTPEEIVLKDASSHEFTVRPGKVKRLVVSQKSIMPENLLRDMTAQQAADLLRFLEALR